MWLRQSQRYLERASAGVLSSPGGSPSFARGRSASGGGGGAAFPEAEFCSLPAGGGLHALQQQDSGLSLPATMRAGLQRGPSARRPEQQRPSFSEVRGLFAVAAQAPAEAGGGARSGAQPSLQLQHDPADVQQQQQQQQQQEEEPAGLPRVRCTARLALHAACLHPPHLTLEAVAICGAPRV